MPRVAVITPTYNRGHNGLLLKTMRSVSGQSCGDFVHLVVDHGSTDNTEDVVRSYGDPRVVYEKIEREHGRRYSSSVANNHGTRMILEDEYFSGIEYVTFLHDDDMLPQASLERRAAAFGGSVQVVYGYTGVCNDKMQLLNIIKGPHTHSPKEIARMLKKRRRVAFPHHSLMVSRHILEGIEFDEMLYAFEDMDFSISVLEGLEEWQMRCVPNNVYYYRIHDDNITTHCGDLSESDVRKYFDRKHGRTRFDEFIENAPKFLRRPQAFLPEGMKRVLRPFRDRYLGKPKDPFPISNEMDPYIEAIENASFDALLHR